MLISDISFSLSSPSDFIDSPFPERAKIPSATLDGRPVSQEDRSGTLSRSCVMRKLSPTMLAFAVCLCLLRPALGSAASRTLKAGDVLGVGEDIVLAGDDVLQIEGTAQKPCRLD